MDLAALFDRHIDYLPEQTTLEKVPGAGGVYLLTDEQDRPIQLATTADLKRALRHRLGFPGETTSASSVEPAEADGSVAGDAPQADQEQSFESEMAPVAQAPSIASAETPAGADDTARPRAIPGKRRIDLREIVRRIWWRRAHSQFELAYEYYRLARVLMPQNYRKQLAFGPAWLVHVDPSATAPQFVAGKFLRSPPGIDLGPFATQSDASRLIEILLDAFDLCRYHNILEQAPRGQACAYFEMGKCAAACDGSIPMSQYRDSILAALAFARGDREATYARLEDAMREAANRKAYERAGMLKKQIDRARGIEHASFSRVRPVEEFNYLVVQRGGGTTRLKPFLVRAGTITPGSDVKRSELAGAVPLWIQQMREPPPLFDSEQRSEHIWLVSHFLFKPDAPGLYLHEGGFDHPDRVVRAIQDRFAPKPEQTGIEG